MSKYRIYELAKQFNTTSKVIIDILARNNIMAKNHMSSVDDNARAIIEHTFARKVGSPAEAKSWTATDTGRSLLFSTVSEALTVSWGKARLSPSFRLVSRLVNPAPAHIRVPNKRANRHIQVIDSK